MASANLGTAWIQVKPSTQGLQSNILRGLRGTGASASNQMGGEIRKSNGLSLGMAAVWGAATAIAYKAIGAITDSFKRFVTSASEIQGLRASFQSLTGSVAKTNAVMTTLYEFGKKTAFSNEEIQSAGRSFLAVGQNAKQMRESLQLAGDIAGATGANLTQLVLPLTQAFSRGKLQTQDFYQILNSGAGALRGTIEQAYKASGGVKELSDAMSDGEITTEILWKAMRMATKEGGFAFQGAIKQAETFNGRMSNLQEAVTNLGLKILGVNAVTGEVQLGGPFDRLSGAVKGATEAISNFNLDSFIASFKNMDAGKLGETLNSKLLGALKSFDGAKVGESIGNMLRNGFGAISKAITDLFGKINWPELGMTVGKQAVGFLLGFATGLLNFDIEPIFKFLVDNWWQVLLGLATVIFAPAKLFGPLVKGISKIPILGPITAWLLNAIRGAGQFLFPKMTAFFNGLFGGIGRVLGSIGNFIKGIFAGLFKFLIAPFRLFDTAVTALFNIFKGFITQVFTGIVNAIRFIFAPVVGFFRAYFGAVRAVVVAVWNGIKTSALVAWNFIRAAFAPVANFFASIFGRARAIVGGVWNNIRAGASAVWGGIRSVFGGVAGFFRSVFSSAYNAVAGVWGRISGFFSGIVGKIKGALSGIYSVGSNLVKGLWNGINDMVGWITGKLKSFGDGVMSGIKNFFGIKSPSRLMRDQVGKMLGLGVAEGITRSTKDAVKAAQRQSSEVLGAFSTENGRSSVLGAQFAHSGSDAAAAQRDGAKFTIINPNPEQTAQIVAQRMKMQGGF